MSTRIGVSIVGASTLLLASSFAPVRAPQILYVHVRVGSDANSGLTPGAGGALQTISEALERASASLPLATNIMIAGALTVTGTVIPYDNLDDPTIPGVDRECFPLPMLAQVSLLRDVANSDPYPIFPVTISRPVIRDSSALGGATLLRFTNAANPPPTACTSGPFAVYSSGGVQVTLRGLDFEYGDPAIDILPNPGGPVSPVLTDLGIRGTRAFRAVTATSVIAPEISGCTMERAAPAAAVPTLIPLNDGLVSLAASGSGTIGGAVRGSTFRVFGSATTDFTTSAGVRFGQPDGSGTVTTSISGCLFSSGPAFSLQYGVEFGLNQVGGPGTTGRFSTVVSKCTFNGSRSGVHPLLVPVAGALPAVGSSLQVVATAFMNLGGPIGAAVEIDMGAGAVLDLDVTGCTMLQGAGAGVLLRNSTPGLGTTEGVLDLTIAQNEISWHGTGNDGIELRAQDVGVSGSISRNKIYNNAADGIELHADVVGAGNPLNSTLAGLDIVNNLIAFNGANGIRNRATQAGTGPGTGTATSTPNVVYNTVYDNVAWGLQNENAGFAAPQAFPVYNSIFEENGPPPPATTDIDLGNLPELANIFSTRFAQAQIPLINNNTNVPSGLPPGGGNFTLPAGSPMIDQADEGTAPVVPAVDHFGNDRTVDDPLVPNNGTNFSDRGAHERP